MVLLWPVTRCEMRLYAGIPDTMLIKPMRYDMADRANSVFYKEEHERGLALWGIDVICL